MGTSILCLLSLSHNPEQQSEVWAHLISIPTRIQPSQAHMRLQFGVHVSECKVTAAADLRICAPGRCQRQPHRWGLCVCGAGGHQPRRMQCCQLLVAPALPRDGACVLHANLAIFSRPPRWILSPLHRSPGPMGSTVRKSKYGTRRTTTLPGETRREQPQIGALLNPLTLRNQRNVDLKADELPLADPARVQRLRRAPCALCWCCSRSASRSMHWRHRRCALIVPLALVAPTSLCLRPHRWQRCRNKFHHECVFWSFWKNFPWVICHVAMLHDDSNLSGTFLILPPTPKRPMNWKKEKRNWVWVSYFEHFFILYHNSDFLYQELEQKYKLGLLPSTRRSSEPRQKCSK